MGLFIFAIVILLIGILVLIAPQLLPMKNTDPKKNRMTGVIGIMVGIILVFSSMVVIIDAGELGVVVVLGRVQDNVLENGVNFVLPYANIVKYPVRLREFSLIDDSAVTARVNDGLNIDLDSTTYYYINPQMAGEVYSKVATSIEILESDILMPNIRTAIRNVCSAYSAEEVYSTLREEVIDEILLAISEMVSNKGIIIDSFLIRDIDLPEEIDTAIELKISAQQEAEAMEYEKQKAQMEAEIKIIDAEGLAEAQSIINSTLTPYYLQHEAIQAYSDLADSENTTFIIMPTSPEGTGIPIVLGMD